MRHERLANCEDEALKPNSSRKNAETSAHAYTYPGHELRWCDVLADAVLRHVGVVFARGDTAIRARKVEHVFGPPTAAAHAPGAVAHVLRGEGIHGGAGGEGVHYGDEINGRHDPATITLSGGRKKGV